jgi:hypothetical protein
MTIPQVSFPVPLEDIPAEVKRLSDYSRGLQAEVRVVSTLIDAVREGCPHTNKKSWTDYGGGHNAECVHCGKTW